MAKLWSRAKKLWVLPLALLLFAGQTERTHAANLNISDSPIFVTQAAPALTMIVLGSDHRLFLPAYNDASDLNNDGNLNLFYDPAIDYYGYFDSYKCYTYNSSKKQFVPTSKTSTKKCSSAWSGDWLNWATMTRIDLIRKVLYGGSRSVDNANSTSLKRANIVQDGHSWGKEYTSPAVDGYNISDYTPLSQPSAGTRHLFANTTLLNHNDNKDYSVNEPLLRVLTNRSERIWDWVSKERPVAGQTLAGGTTVTPTDYIVQVEVCDKNVGLEENCQQYSVGTKPVGLLQLFGENDKMHFGLISRSYEKNFSGGVLRKNISSLTNEITPRTRQFSSALNSVIRGINRLAITGFSSNYTYQNGWIVHRPALEGEFKDWGNPIGEMMYEALRYFAGKGGPTPHFNYSGGVDQSLGLPQPSWEDPYQKYPACAKPNILVISDVNTSYDSDSVPGSAFSSFTGDLSPALNATALGQTIWDHEMGASGQYFIGQSGLNYDGTPSAKTVTSFGNIRGLPEEPTKQGSYYPASVAYYGWLNDISSAEGVQQVHTYVAALNSPLPSINILVGGSVINLVPFAKTVGGCSIGGGTIDPSPGAFQPTNQIVDFYVESLTPTSGVFRVSFDDVEQGGDYDMDALVKYSYQVKADGTVTIGVTSEYAAGCLIQHIGYVISGTTADGTYLEVRDKDTALADDVIYFLDTPPGQLPGERDSFTKLPVSTERTFTPGPSNTGSLLKNPLYYAAKWGGFRDTNNNKIPDLQKEWDLNNDGVPDNYFLISSPLELATKLEKAFLNILARSSTAAAATINGGTLNSESRMYQVAFNSQAWSGQVLSFKLDPNTGAVLQDGAGPEGSEWDAAEQLDLLNFNTGRHIISYNANSQQGVSFRWPTSPASPGNTDLDAQQIHILNTNPATGAIDNLGKERLEYLRGNRAHEVQNGGAFRDRVSVLGDIVHSEPLYVGVPLGNYPDTWPAGAAENAAPYSTFKQTYANRTPVLYVGANDGMLHAFNAQTGVELFAYVPNASFNHMNELTAVNYSHKYFVDGNANAVDAFIGGAWKTVLVGSLRKGGQGIFALDVTNPANFSESNAKDMVLWEFTDQNDADLGYTYSQPAIVRQPDGVWVAIFGNGYNNTVTDGHVSSTGNAVLYVVNLETGQLIQKIDTGVGMLEDPTLTYRPNGLATPAAVDLNSNHIADLIYAGDLFGNLWKFYWDSGTNSWQIAHFGNALPTPLFVAKDSNGNHQPITVRPIVRKTAEGVAIYFGTGKFFELIDADVSQAKPQSFYALMDNLDVSTSGGVIQRSQLLQQSILSEQTFVADDGTTTDVRVTTDHTLDSNHRGWFMDLVQPGGAVIGERVIHPALLRSNRVIFTTMIPSSDPCTFGGSGWLMELNALSGSRLYETPFDLNRDGKFDSQDFVTSGGTQVAASGVKSKVGIIPAPTVINAGTAEYKYLPGSSGEIDVIRESAARGAIGRQSWNEIR